MPKYIKHLARWVWLLGLILCLLCGRRWGWNKAQANPRLMTRIEVQERLCEMGYKVKIDGNIGRKSNAAWALAEEDQTHEYYAQYFTLSGAPE